MKIIFNQLRLVERLQFRIDYTLGTILLYRYEENNFLKIFIVASNTLKDLPCGKQKKKEH